MTSSGQPYSLTPAKRPASELSSGADTGVVRVQHVGADDFDLGALGSHRRCAGEALADTVSSAGEQRESHPPLKFNRGGRGGDVAKAHAARLVAEQLGAVAQPPGAIDGAYTDQLQSIARAHPRALGQGAADEVALFFQQPFEAQVRGAGIAVKLRARDVSLLDAQRVERVESVRSDAEVLARLQQRAPGTECVSRRYGELVGE